MFWLVDYTPEMYDRAIGTRVTAARDAYRCCGLDFDLGPDCRSDALLRASTGEATLTLVTAERLRLWLERHGQACGPVRVAPDAY